MSRLIFVNRFFFPDHSATWHVTGSFNRLSFVLPVDAAMPGRIGAATDPPLTSVIAMGAARHKDARLVNWLQDIYPETAVELGVPLMRGPLAAILTARRDRSLRQADATVVVGNLMARKVELLGASPSRVHVITNWCNDQEIRPIAPADNPLRQAWGLAGQFVLGYSGNLGRAHEFETVLAAAKRLRHAPHTIFLMVGGGKRSTNFRERSRSKGSPVHSVSCAIKSKKCWPIPWQSPMRTGCRLIQNSRACWFRANFMGLPLPAGPSSASPIRTGILLGLCANTAAALSSHQAMPTPWLMPYGGCQMRQSRVRKWAGGREQCLTRILHGRKRSNGGPDCSIGSMNRPASECRRLNSPTCDDVTCAISITNQATDHHRSVCVGASSITR